ncbi:2,3-bisphosphoglycerate-independent phosphoglycerate mutase [Candidatus Marinamargulisbacteria bacterium SCGC AG-414-C22]|nr:2,3-bisphosphoglycerate-independent phosphoglycerate mutase [Candidatus Marinamargulisbacteria bacterium SCGC AG-414-C22]
MSKKLQRHKHFKTPTGPVVLIIMDGVGIGKNEDNNAVYKAHTPFLNAITQSPLYTQLKAHGTAVGMPTDNDMGNSEVGHNALGAGRVFHQGSALVKQAIETKAIFKSKTWINGLNFCKTSGKTLHLIGLLSDGNVHNHIDYQISLINQAIEENITKIRCHILLDGRDVEPRSALSYVEKLTKIIKEHQQNGIDIDIASGGGRMVITMDRYNADWNMVKRGWDTHVLGKATPFSSAEAAINAYYANENSTTDQDIPPFVITKDNEPIGKINDGDTVFYTNFRGDRAIELSQAFENPHFDKFDREYVPNIFYAGMLEYDGDQKIPQHYLVNPPQIEHSLSTYLCAENIHSFAISETQKYGHVTYFWNGNKSGYINKDIETYIEIPSDNCPFNKKPLMKAHEITAKAIELLDTKTFQFGRINFPNGDMVGHTGDFDATVKTMETVDDCTEKICNKVLELNGTCIILADHGNADDMYSLKDGEKTPKTAHTLNPVPCAIISQEQPYQLAKITLPGLANVAATICNLLGYEAPVDYEPSLIIPNDVKTN